jgi:hypothetical protein
MVDQAQQVNQSNGAGRTEVAPPRAVARSAGELIQDIVTLAELQGKLVMIDAHEGVSTMLASVAVLVVGLACAFSCIPVALATLALVLVETTQLTAAQAFGIALGVGLVLAALMIGGAILALRGRSGIFARSQAEWRQNVKWAKDAIQRLSRSPRSPPARQPHVPSY